jgi:broad specificity phosphatase PhoE
MSVIYLVRHGQASLFSADYDLLTPLGEEQANLLGASLNHRKFMPSAIVAGSLKRHLQTKDGYLAAQTFEMESAVVPAWNEYDHTELLVKHNPVFTDFEAIGAHIIKSEVPLKELQKILNDAMWDWIQDKHSYTKTWEQFKGGVWEALNELGSTLQKDQDAIVFTSGGPISVVMMKLLNLDTQAFFDLQQRIVNTSVTKVISSRNGLSLSTFNDYSHLEHNKLLVTYR